MHFTESLAAEVGQERADAILTQAEKIVSGALYTRPWFRLARSRGLRPAERHSDFVAHVAGALLMEYASGVTSEKLAGVRAMRSVESHYRFLYSPAYKCNQHLPLDENAEAEVDPSTASILADLRDVATPRQIEIAETVASLGSRKAAARMLGIDPSAVRRAMQAIERKLVGS